MATAEIADCYMSIGGDGNRCGLPLLHLRGTEYGLRVHGLPMGTEEAADDDLKECHHG
jgi:hypothetical protein